MKKPLIGITAAYTFDRDVHAQRSTYLRAVWRAGADAIFLPCAPDASGCEAFISAVDGLLVPAGPDVSPQLYGEQPIPQAPTTRKSEDLFEIALIKEAKKQGKPILGICRGMQILNVAFGGSLYQDIPSQFGMQICHSQGQTIRDEGTHLVKMDEDCRLAKIFKSTEFYVNSYHHQAVKELAESEFKIVGRALDGIPEAIENADGSIMGVQWHPECMPQEKMFQDLFTDFVKRCSKE